jgi:hypothetical protein
MVGDGDLSPHEWPKRDQICYFDQEIHLNPNFYPFTPPPPPMISILEETLLGISKGVVHANCHIYTNKNQPARLNSLS